MRLWQLLERIRPTEVEIQVIKDWMIDLNRDFGPDEGTEEPYAFKSDLRRDLMAKIRALQDNMNDIRQFVSEYEIDDETHDKITESWKGFVIHHIDEAVDALNEFEDCCVEAVVHPDK